MHFAATTAGMRKSKKCPQALISSIDSTKRKHTANIDSPAVVVEEPNGDGVGHNILVLIEAESNYDFAS